jgi:hypothetical protein
VLISKRYHNEQSWWHSSKRLCSEYQNLLPKMLALCAPKHLRPERASHGRLTVFHTTKMTRSCLKATMPCPCGLGIPACSTAVDVVTNHRRTCKPTSKTRCRSKHSRSRQYPTGGMPWAAVKHQALTASRNLDTAMVAHQAVGLWLPVSPQLIYAAWRCTRRVRRCFATVGLVMKGGGVRGGERYWQRSFNLWILSAEFWNRDHTVGQRGNGARGCSVQPYETSPEKQKVRALYLVNRLQASHYSNCSSDSPSFTHTYLLCFTYYFLSSFA